MKTPQEDVKACLRIEELALKTDKAFYLECLNNLPLSNRKTEKEIRDGCILISMVYQAIKAKG
jgi:hypothetical protein